MSHDGYFDYYEGLSNWAFDEFGIFTESLTDWDLYGLLRHFATPDSRILDLGCGGGEKLLADYPDCAEIVGTDYSPGMVETARRNLSQSGRENISFKVMDNHKMDVPDGYFDIVVARHTITDPSQIFRCLKPGGRLLIRGVDKYDCWSLKMLFGGGQGCDDPVPVSIVDYENVLRAGFSDVELVPICEREYFRDREVFRAFLAKVPILERIDDGLIDEYVSGNTYEQGIRLLRAYYGITARRPE